MKIKFLNITTPHEEYYVDEGSVITKCKNETLDSATIIISNTEDVLDLEPLDECVLIDEQGRLEDIYLCVETVNITEICLLPKIYRYDISLISETKGLEGIILPNMSITRPYTAGTDKIGSKIQDIVQEYSPKIRKIRTSDNFKYKSNKYTCSGEVTDMSSKIPEFQWNNPTLREVITDLMMVEDCIPVVRQGRIYKMDLTADGRDISNYPEINYVQQSRTLTDYVSDLRMNLSNTLQENQNNVNSIVRRVEYIPYTAANDYILTSENSVLKTEFPILKINSLKMAFGYLVKNWTDHQTAGEPFYEYLIGSKEVDLCDFNGKNGVYEEKAFRVLPRIISDNVLDSMIDPDNFGEYQNFSVYYTRGTNIIQGFAETTERRLAFISQGYSTNNLLKAMFMSYYFPNTSVDLSTGTFQNTFFKIDYETSAEMVFEASKGDYPRNKRVVVDNQTNSYVNAYNQGFLEYQKANRLGNLIKQINARYESNYQNLIDLGDIYKDSVVYQVQYQIYKDHIEVNALATKNYILRDYFTGVKAKIRSWKIASGDEALTRHELRKFYCELDYEPFQEIDIPEPSTNTAIGAIWPDVQNTTFNYATYFSSSLDDGSSNNPIRKCAIRFNGYQPSEENEVFFLEVVPRILGNSLDFTFGCQDNFGIEKVANLNSNYITFPTDGEEGTNECGFPVLTTISNGMGGIPLQDLRYCSQNGNVSTVMLMLGTAINKGFPMNTVYQEKYKNSGSDTWIVYTPYPDANIAAGLRDYYNQNTGEIGDLTQKVFYDKINFESLKDNREILKFSYQFEFCCATTDITIGKAMMTRQSAICYGSRENYNVMLEDTVLGTRSSVTLETMSSGICKITFDLGTSVNDGETIKVIEQNTNELILSFVKKGTSSSQILYLNFLIDTRNKTWYPVS